MARVVQKFGGTSVADIACIHGAAAKVKAEIDLGNQVAVVVSAMAGATNELVNQTLGMSKLYDVREYDAVVAAGEQVAAGLMALALQNEGVDARSWLGWQIPIRTDDAHGKARIQGIETDELLRRMAVGQVPVVSPGHPWPWPERPACETCRIRRNRR